MMLGTSEIVSVGMDSSTSSSQAGSKTSTVEIPKGLGGDNEFYRLRFLDESPRLFRKDTDELETFIIPNSDSSMRHGTELMIPYRRFLIMFRLNQYCTKYRKDIEST